MTRKIQQKRNFGIDIVRLIFSFLVICYHTGTLSNVHSTVLIKPINALIVPFFITVSGYFHHSIEQRGLEKKEIITYLKYTIFVNFVYFIWTWIETIIDGDGIFEYILSPINRYDIINFIFFNESPFKYHLWYLGAMLYVLIIYRIFNKYNKKKVLFILCPILYIAGIVLGKYSMVFLGKMFPTYINRNFLFYTLPFFCLGDLIWIFKDKLLKIKLKSYCLSFIFLYLIGLLENSIVLKFTKYDNGHYYFSTFLLMLSFFMILIEIYDDRDCSKLEKLLARLGKNDASFIYFWQYIVMYIIKKLLKLANIQYTALLVAILTFIICILVSELNIYIKKQKYIKNKTS